jgi:hypothetical protein
MDNYLDLLPNMPEEEQEQPIFNCDCCGNGIYLGETYFIVGQDVYCNNCVYERIARKGVRYLE